MENIQKLKNVVAETLQIDPDTITDETSPQNVPSWDSFNGLMLASELEREFQVSFTIEDITSVQTVKDIKSALARHGVIFT